MKNTPEQPIKPNQDKPKLAIKDAPTLVLWADIGKLKVQRETIDAQIQAILAEIQSRPQDSE